MVIATPTASLVTVSLLGKVLHLRSPIPLSIGWSIAWYHHCESLWDYWNSRCITLRQVASQHRGQDDEGGAAGPGRPGPTMTIDDTIWHPQRLWKTVWHRLTRCAESCFLLNPAVDRLWSTTRSNGSQEDSGNRASENKMDRRDTREQLVNMDKNQDSKSTRFEQPFPIRRNTNSIGFVGCRVLRARQVCLWAWGTWTKSSPMLLILLVSLVSLVSHRTRLTDKPCLQSTSRDSASSVKLCTSLRAPHDEAFVFSSSSLKQKKKKQGKQNAKKHLWPCPPCRLCGFYWILLEGNQANRIPGTKAWNKYVLKKQDNFALFRKKNDTPGP